MDQWGKLVGLVKEFYIAFGQQEFLEKEITDERIKLRKKLFDEEFKEYEAAEKNNNRVEMLDAVCDMNYIYLGTLLEKNNGDVDAVVKNIFFEGDMIFEKIWAKIEKNKFDKIFCDAFEEVHRSNMSKLENGKAIFQERRKNFEREKLF